MKENKEEKYLENIMEILNTLEYAEDYLTLEDIMEKTKIDNKTQIQNILNKLKEKKIIGSSRGKNGGYFLTETIKDMNKEYIKIILD